MSCKQKEALSEEEIPAQKVNSSLFHLLRLGPMFEQISEQALSSGIPQHNNI
jgi:hypothetical protein